MINCDSLLINLLSLNVRGLKANSDYVRLLLSDYCPVILCICEHWLHSFESSLVPDLIGDYQFVIATVEEPHAYIPRFIRGRSGVAILWSPELNDLIFPITSPRNDRLLGIRISTFSRPTVVFSVYLPCRSGGTDPFKYVMDELDSLFTLFPDDIILFAGDFNANPGVLIDDLSYPPNEQGIILNRYLEKWNYVSSHLQPSLNLSRQFLTHESEAHSSFSILDHVLCPKHFVSEFRSAFVDTEHPLNSSDHLPVVCSFPIQFKPVLPPPSIDHPGAIPLSVNWSRCDSVMKERYADSVEALLPDVPSVVSIHIIEDIIESVTHTLLSSASTCLPVSRYQKHVRPFWNNELRRLHTLMKVAYRNWVKIGKSAVPMDYSRRSYKESKTVFRRELRKAKRQELDHFYNSLDLSDRGIYRHIRLRNGKVSSGTNFIIVDNVRFEGSCVRDGWSVYFNKLASPDTTTFSQSHFTSINTRILSILLDDDLNDLSPVSITPDMVAQAISSLALKKAAGPDGLSGEHFSFGPVMSIARILAPVFQALLTTHYIPNSLRLAYIIPILKGRHLDPSNPSNYRGISVGSIFSKLFEFIILHEYLFSLSDKLHPLQGGFRQGLRTSHTSYILNECIVNSRETGSKCFVAFLDARKAFDTVWHDGLFVKLFDLGINLHIWHTLYFWYRHLQSCIKWSGGFSEPFPIHQGVRQGALLSPLLYSLFINDLLSDLEESGVGIYINSIFCGTPTYADDMSLVAQDPVDLQVMLDIASRYSYNWQYTFNPSKSKVMVFGESSVSRKRNRSDRSWFINSFLIAETDTWVHLGITLSVSRSSLYHTLHSISSARSAFFSLQSIGSRFGCLHPSTSLKLYKAMVLPILIFGLEVVFPSASEILMLERCQLSIFRIILGLPVRAPSYAIHYLLGTLPIKLLLLKAHLSFLFRLLSLPDNNIFKRLFLSRFHNSQYGFSNHIVSILNELDFPDVDELTTIFPSKLAWSAFVKCTLYLHFYDLLDSEVHKMPSLAQISIIHPPKMARIHPILCYTKGDVKLNRLNNFRLRLLLHCSILNNDTSMFHISNKYDQRSAVCPACGADMEDSFHFVSVCPVYAHIRENLCSLLRIPSNEILFQHMFGNVWEPLPNFQLSLLQFLTELRSARSRYIM